MIDGTRIRLREPRDGDLGVLAGLRNDVGLQQLLLARPRPNSLTRVREWVDRISARDDAIFFVVADSSDAVLGFVQVTEMNLVDGHGYLGIALKDDARGAGNGAEAVDLLASYLVSVFSLRKLMLNVASGNEAAIAMYRASGFREVGVLKGHVRQGAEYLDVTVMERFLSP